jgi:signal transduction histidine kinase
MYESDRQLVAYEIHDTFVQQVTAAHMNLEVFQHVRTQDAAAAQKALDQALQLLREGIAEARWLISGLRPAMLDELGLAPAVDFLARESQRRTGVNIEWSHQVRFDRLPRPLETALYRIIQESLTNALHHSRSEKVRLAMVQQGGKIRVEVEDWGCGFFRQQVASERYGLQGICERARLFGGRAEIDSVPGRGTRVVVELPWSDGDAAETHAPIGASHDA